MALLVFLRWLRFLWRTRHCPHPPHRLRTTHNEEHLQTGYGARCRDCGTYLD